MGASTDGLLRLPPLSPIIQSYTLLDIELDRFEAEDDIGIPSNLTIVPDIGSYEFRSSDTKMEL